MKSLEPQQPRRNFTDLLQSQGNTPEEDNFVSLIVESDEITFYMGELKALFSGELPSEPNTTSEALSGPYADKWKAAMDTEMQTV